MDVQPQPTPLSWQWTQTAGTVQRTPDSSPEAVTLVRLSLSGPNGTFVGFWLPDDLDKLLNQGHEEATKARTGISTHAMLPRGLPHPSRMPPANGTRFPPGGGLPPG